MTAPVSFREKVRFFSLAPRAPSKAAVSRFEISHRNKPLTDPCQSVMLSTWLEGRSMQFSQLKRREFIALLGCAATVWPLAAHGQQAERMRHIGVMVSGAADNPDVQVWLATFKQGLQQLGWIEGRNLRIEYRLGALGEPERTRKYAAELVALAPDVIFSSGTSQVGPLLQATRTVPIIFTLVADPVGAGGGILCRLVSARKTSINTGINR